MRSIVAFFILFIVVLSLDSADWLYLSGTEKASVKRIHFWGFVQAGYQNDNGSIFEKNGINKTPFVMLPPNLDRQSSFELNRARLAVRGKIDDNNLFNYFIMTEFGQNGITQPAGHTTNNYLTDASITYRGLGYCNIRLGQFKYPGSEEGMRAVFATEYRNFTAAGNQLLLERFLPNSAKETAPGIYQAAPTESVGAFRDRGIELFYTVAVAKKMHVSFAGMVGSGTGLSSSNASHKPTYYAYLASEYLFGKVKGYLSESLKAFVWYQKGTRRLHNTNYMRERYGLGIDYFHNGLRIDIEYIKARGMIYNGAKDVDTLPNSVNWEYVIAADADNVADGGYISGQYYLIAKKLEFLARYDYLNRLTNSSSARRDFKTTTVGLSYHFKGATRIDLNYAFREIKAPGNRSAQDVLDNCGNLLSIQATLKF